MCEIFTLCEPNMKWRDYMYIYCDCLWSNGRLIQIYKADSDNGFHIMTFNVHHEIIFTTRPLYIVLSVNMHLYSVIIICTLFFVNYNTWRQAVAWWENASFVATQTHNGQSMVQSIFVATHTHTYGTEDICSYTHTHIYGTEDICSCTNTHLWYRGYL